MCTTHLFSDFKYASYENIFLFASHPQTLTNEMKNKGGEKEKEHEKDVELRDTQDISLDSSLPGVTSLDDMTDFDEVASTVSKYLSSLLFFSMKILCKNNQK